MSLTTTKGEGDVLFGVDSMAIGMSLFRARISCGPVGGLEPNLQGYNIGP